jgi:formate dehydrogenase beta subunit
MTNAASAVAGAWTTDPSRLPDELSATFRGVMGWGGVAVWDESVDIVDLTREFAARTVQECCGQCFPCRIGMHEVADILDDICEGKGTDERLQRALELSRHVAEASRCDLGRTGGYAVLESLEQHHDRFVAAVAAKKLIPRGRYAAAVVAPCMAACPAGVDIPAYVEQLRIDEVERSAEAVRRRCPMPATIGRVCVRPCEDACRRGSVDEPVAIRTLKRFVADSEAEPTACPMPGHPRVAVIGAGPAGLACAYYLGMDGVTSTVFEALPEAGGMAAVGIPDYRLPREVLRAEVERVESLGVKIAYNFRFGVDATMDQLFEEGYEAVFVAVGAHQSASMGCEGEDAGYDGFMPGVEFLREIAFGKKPLTGDTILVIGGGNVAMDCVRSARRLGFDDVKLLYRRTEAEMPADPVEIAEAKEEGVEMVTLVAPTRITAEDGRVTGLECRRMQLGEPDASGRRRPEPIEGSEFVIPCDCIVPAIGQVCSVDQLMPSHI